MKKYFVHVFGGMALLVLLGSPPAAADDMETCAKSSGDVAIAACTRAITSGRYKGLMLALLFHNRAVAWANKKDYDRAIADYNEAIRLDPKYAEPHNNRGNAYSDKG